MPWVAPGRWLLPSCLGRVERRSWGAVRWMASCWQVSSCGRVKSAKGEVTAGSLTSAGYRRVMILRREYYVHRLVAATFLGPPPSLKQWQVNHIDNNGSNNSVANLQYVSPTENLQHSWDTNCDRRSNAAKMSKAVLWRACGHNSWSACSSQIEAARKLGVDVSCVSRCRRGLTASCRGSEGRYEFAPADGAEPDILPGEVWMNARYPGDQHNIPGLMVSDHGRILATSSYHRLLSRGYVSPQGYCRVKKAGRHYLVHRLVAGTFLGEPELPVMEVNHIDANRSNNHVQNLEYVTRSQSMHHAYALAKAAGRTTGKAVRARRHSSDSTWLEFSSVRSCASHTGISKDAISKTLIGQLGHCRVGAWEFRLPAEEWPCLPNEEWRPAVFHGARVSRPKQLESADTSQLLKPCFAD
ncbi:unnamed protein product [Symbiodinium sp. CCMP2592]|nr:unnamed protein product [Symbiodinium sp. CCMP2592]